MKSKLKVQTAGAMLALLLSLGTAFSQGIPGVPGTGGPTIDPTTGLPIAQAMPDWKDANWKDPDIVLTNVDFDGQTLAEVAGHLREQFKAQFDLLLPSPTSGEHAINKINGLPVPDTDWKATPIRLQLKNVTASEVFNAMNLVFENDQTPLRWELKVNGHRQIALLRVLVEQNPQFSNSNQELRKVYFIGDLIGDEKSGGMAVKQVIKTIRDIWPNTQDWPSGFLVVTDNGRPAVIQFHEEAQLLVVTGSPEQVDFVQQTLIALRQKVEFERRQSKAIESKPATVETKSGGGGGSGGISR